MALYNLKDDLVKFNEFDQFDVSSLAQIKTTEEVDKCMKRFWEEHAGLQAYDFDAVKSEIQDKLEWWMQPRLFLYFLGASGLMMAAIGFYIYAKLRDIYPYNLIATACLTEAAIYWRFMRMIVCPTQIFVILINMFPVYGWEISYYQYYQSFQTVIVLFAAQIYAFAVVNLSMQLFICYDFF